MNYIFYNATNFIAKFGNKKMLQIINYKNKYNIYI